MSVSDIEEQIREMYDFEVSTSNSFPELPMQSKRSSELAKQTIRRALSNCLDGWNCFKKKKLKIINKTIYLAVGLNRDGKKEVLGMWLGKNESSSFG